MKFNKLLQLHWSKLLAGAFFVFLVGAYAQIFAIATPYTPGATLDPDCLPNEVNCTVNMYPGLGISLSTGSAWGTSYSTSGTGNVALTTSPVFTTPNIGEATGNISGNAGTVTNGVYTNGSYSDPAWLTLSKSKVGLANVDNTADSLKNVLYATTSGALTSMNISQFTNNSNYIIASSTLTGLVQSTATGTSYITGGSLGIGTTDPSSNLHIHDSTTNTNEAPVEEQTPAIDEVVPDEPPAEEQAATTVESSGEAEPALGEVVVDEPTQEEPASETTPETSLVE
jgi:hypothetical protein